MHWELWDTESGNLVEEYETEEEGLCGARDVLAVNAPDFAEHLVLGAVRDEGESTPTGLPPVLRGAALVEKISGLMRSDSGASQTLAVASTIRTG